MTYSSKRTVVSMAAGIILITAYIVYALGRTSPESGDLKSWALGILVFIGISVAVQIVIQILFHIAYAIGIAVKEGENDDKKIGRLLSSSMVEDEMYKLISLKSSHVGYICAGAGFVVALVALALEMPAVVALHVLFGSCAACSLVEGSVSIYLHEKGVHSG